LSQDFLVGMQVVSVPAQEVAGSVDCEGLVDVLCDEIIETGLDCGDDFVGLCGRRNHALNSFDVCFSVFGAHNVPDVCIRPGSSN
jgi:hypothetical protein